MYTVKHPSLKGMYGTTCGLRKDGSRAVLWSDETIDWFKFEEFASMISAKVA